MAVSLEQFKRGEFGQGDSFKPDLPPMNQVFAKAIREHQEKVQVGKKEQKSRKRKEEEHLITQKLRFQKEIDHVLGGHDDMDTSEGWAAFSTINRAVSSNEVVLETFKTDNRRKTASTIVDFTRIIVLPKEASNKEIPLEQERLAS